MEGMCVVNSRTKLLDTVAASLKFDIDRLSSRECECICYMLRGMTTKQVAAVMCLSPRTVEGYITNVKNKLGCKNRYEIISKVLGDDFPWEILFRLNTGKIDSK